MIDDEDSARWTRLGAPWRRARDVIGDCDEWVLSEQLADDLVSELAGLGPRSRARLARASGDGGAHPVAVPQAARVPARPRLVVLPGGKA